jgi:hypothetical protein
MVNLIIHRSSLRGTPSTAVLRRFRDSEQRLVTDIPQKAVPEPTLMLDSVAVCALSHRHPRAAFIKRRMVPEAGGGLPAPSAQLVIGHALD